jgi:hypothetical protein
MAFSEKDINSLLETMEKAMRGGLRPSSSRNYNQSQNSGNSGGDDGDFGEAVKAATKNTKKLSEALEDVLVTVQDQEDALSKANDSLINSSKSFGSLDAELNILYKKSIPDARKYILAHSQATKNLTNELSKTIRNQSLFSASLLESHNEVEHGTIEYTKMINEMYEAADGVSKGLLRQAGVWDEATDTIQKNLNPQDFGRLNIALGNAQLAITESFGGMEGIGKLSKAAEMSLEKFVEATSANTPAGKTLQSQIISAVAQLERQGQKLEIMGAGGEKQGVSVLGAGGVLDQNKIDELQGNAEVLAKVTKALAENVRANEITLKDFAEIAHSSNTVLGSWTKKVAGTVNDLTTLSGVVKVAKNALFMLADTALIKKSFDMLKQGVTDTYKNLADFNIAQVPASFASVNVASLKMGMSFDETVKFMQENKRALAVYGDNFGTLTGNLKDTFAKFGYTMKQGAEVVGPAFESAIGAGINVRSTDQLNKFVDQTMQAYQDVAGVINMSAADFAKLNAALLSSTDIQNNLLGLSEQERLAKTQEIFNTRKSYIAMGLNADAADELIRAQAAQKHEAIKDQLAQAGKLQLSAQMSGLSGAQSAKLGQLSMLSAAGRTPEQEKEYQALLRQEETGRAQRMSAAYGTHDIGAIAVATTVNQATEGAGAIGTERAAAQKMATTAAAGGALTDEQMKRQAEAAKGSAGVAEIGNVINSVSSLLSNSFTKGLLGATGSLFGLMIQARLTSNALGGGGAGGIFSKLKGLFGGGGGAAATEGAAKATEKVVEKEGAELLGKEGAKVGAKAIGKSLLKKIPGIGFLAGLVFAGQRAMAGDFAGAGLEVASGAASTIPGIGTAASIALDAGIAARDIHNASASPAPGSPPSVSGGPGSGASQDDVNTAAAQAAQGTEGGEKILGVQDMTAHDYLSTIADNMAQAVKLLQAMSDNGNQVPAQVVANRIQQTTMKPIPSATSYMTGRQTAPA